MYTVKGPYGYFLYEDPDTNKPTWDYAVNAINKSFLDYLLPVYINKASGEISYDCSNLMSIDSYCQNHSTGKTTSNEIRRKHLKDLFTFIFSCPDYLLSPANILWDTEYIFTDSSGETIKLCMRPFYEESGCLSVSLIDTDKLERTLKHEFFKDILSDEEIDRIIYSVNNNSGINSDELFTGKYESTDKRNNIKIGDDTIFGLAAAVLSLILFITGSPIPSMMFFTLAVITQISSLIKSIRRRHQTEKQSKKEKSQSRKEVLFGNNNTSDSEFGYLTLTSKQHVNGDFIKRTVYSKTAILGSDQFLSDIQINDKSILPVQAEIIRKNNIFYLKDKSDNHSTYLESRQLTPDKKYEIKNGQTITLGDIELEITIGKA